MVEGGIASQLVEQLRGARLTIEKCERKKTNISIDEDQTAIETICFVFSFLAFTE